MTHALAMTVAVLERIAKTLVSQENPALVVCCTMSDFAGWAVVIMARFVVGNATEVGCTPPGMVNTGVHLVPPFTVCTIWPCEVMAQPALWECMVRCARTGRGAGVVGNVVARLIPLTAMRAVQ